MADRIPCLNPRCRRTAPAAKYAADTQIICGKCWRTVPLAIRARQRQIESRFRRVDRMAARRVLRGTLQPDRAAMIVQRAYAPVAIGWQSITARFTAPERPAGLDGFLQEAGLA